MRELCVLCVFHTFLQAIWNVLLMVCMHFNSWRDSLVGTDVSCVCLKAWLQIPALTCKAGVAAHMLFIQVFWGLERGRSLGTCVHMCFCVQLCSLVFCYVAAHCVYTCMPMHTQRAHTWACCSSVAHRISPSMACVHVCVRARKYVYVLLSDFVFTDDPDSFVEY